MTVVLLTIGIFAFAMTGMALGVILSNRRLKGSCGGSGEDCVCEIEKRRACHAAKKFQRSGLGEPGDRSVVWAGDRVSTESKPAEL